LVEVFDGDVGEGQFGDFVQGDVGGMDDGGGEEFKM